MGASVSRILLIDDELSSRLVMQNRLKDLGHEAVVAENGAKGLLEAREAPFELVIVEYNLASGVSGLEVCRRLKQVPQAMTVPVLVVSRQPVSREDMHKGFEAGADAFVAKPDLPLLDDVLGTLLRFKALHDELTRQLRAQEDFSRRLQEAQQRGGADGGSGGESGGGREGAPTRPDGILMVDADGIVRYTDRGARDLFGAGLEGRNLGRLAPASGLEAFVRDARTEAREGFRFDLPARNSRAARALSAGVVPLITAPGSKDPELRVVLLCDLGRRRVTNELIRLQDYVLPRRELGVLLDAARSAFGPATIVGASSAAARVRSQVAEAARSAQPVLILGEPGTGKEHVARSLHFASDLGGPFLPVGCAGLSAENLESELFGHVRGAFEGVLNDRPGLFQQGAHGTIFLEDVDQLPLHLQEKVLRALREGKVTRAGSERAEPTEVRVVASSSVDLAAKVRDGMFLADLHQELSRLVIPIPALRERREDVPLLIKHFLVRFGAGLPAMEVSDSALWTMENHEWPSNVRELETCVRRACMHAASSQTIEIEHLPAALVELAERLPSRDLVPTPPPARVALGSEHSGAQPGSAPPRLELGAAASDRSAARKPWEIAPDDPPSLELYEMKALLHALDRTGGDKLAAARLLKVGKSTLYRKLKRYGIA
jgi:DNA-binding NtrC family response regulator